MTLSPKQDISISPAMPEDAHSIQEIFYKTWLDTYPNQRYGITKEDIQDRFKEAFTEETIKQREYQILNPKTDTMIFVAKIGGKTIGLCRIVVNDEANLLQAIYVLPEYQGRGVGKALWNEIRKNFDPKIKTIVNVATYNNKAISFYEKLGFKDTGKRWQDDTFKMKSGSRIPEMEMELNDKI